MIKAASPDRVIASQQKCIDMRTEPYGPTSRREERAGAFARS
jgi:hypothetical protein